jgi:hypothetical protein
LGDEIAVVADIAARAILVLGADTSKENKLAVDDPFDGHCLGEDASRPGAVGEFLFLVCGWRLLLCRCRKDKRECSHDREKGGTGELCHGDTPWPSNWSERTIFTAKIKAASSAPTVAACTTLHVVEK